MSLRTEWLQIENRRDTAWAALCLPESNARNTGITKSATKWQCCVCHESMANLCQAQLSESNLKARHDACIPCEIWFRWQQLKGGAATYLDDYLEDKKTCAFLTASKSSFSIVTALSTALKAESKGMLEHYKENAWKVKFKLGNRV